MAFGLQEILVAGGAVLTTWIFNNVKLREGITEWFLTHIGKENYSIKDHNVLLSLKSIKFESKLNDFDNILKSELYHYYIDTVLDNMLIFIENILEKNKKLSLDDSKRMIKNALIDTLTIIEEQIDNNIKLPIKLQDKFNKFKNYLTMQHLYAIENALHTSNKKRLLFQVFDAIENNNRWFLFYSTEMFENFNGYFDTLTRSDIFLN